MFELYVPGLKGIADQVGSGLYGRACRTSVMSYILANTFKSKSLSLGELAQVKLDFSLSQLRCRAESS